MKSGSIGAFIIGVFYIVFILLLTVIIPSQGFEIGEGSLYDANESLAYAAASPMLRYFYLQYFLIIIGLVLLVPTMHQQLIENSKNLITIATVLGTISAFLFFLNLTLGYLNIPLLQNLLEQNSETVKGTYVAITLMSGAMVYGGFFTYGWWISIISLVALRSTEFPNMLNYLGIVVGVSGILSFFITQLSFLMILSSIFWSIYLGVVLLRKSRTT